MIYEEDLKSLVDDWQKRLKDTTQPLSYRDALGECIMELNSILKKSEEDDLDYIDYLKDKEANIPEYFYADAI